MASLYTLSVIAAWYFSNIGVILLNKYLLSVYGFRYPIFLTMMHMVRACGWSQGPLAPSLDPESASYVADFVRRSLGSLAALESEGEYSDEDM